MQILNALNHTKRSTSMTNNNFHANLLKEISQINLSREQIKALNKLNIFEKVEPCHN